VTSSVVPTARGQARDSKRKAWCTNRVPHLLSKISGSVMRVLVMWHCTALVPSHVGPTPPPRHRLIIPKRTVPERDVIHAALGVGARPKRAQNDICHSL